MENHKEVIDLIPERGSAIFAGPLLFSSKHSFARKLYCIIESFVQYNIIKEEKTMCITNNNIITDVARDLRGFISLGLGAQQMTEDELAKKLGVHQTAVSGWLTGKCKPRKSRFEKICRVFEVENIETAIEKYY